MPEPVDVIAIEKVSQYLVAQNNQKAPLFGGRKDPNLPQMLYTERKSLEWAYDLDSSEENLVNVANYVFGLCRFNKKAQSIINGSSGGSVVPVSPATLPDPYDFEVSASSFIATGVASKTISLFRGFNILFVRGGIPQSTVDTGGSYYSWDRTTGAFVCSPAAVVGELFQLYPLS